MSKTILFLITLLTCNLSFGQDKAGAEKLVDQGVAYHDKGDYEGAISKYDKALELDKDNLFALVEKAYTLNVLEKYDASIKICEKAIAVHPGEEDLNTLYVTYGNDFDALKKTDKSIEIYEEGIKLFPDYYQLYFNKGITLASVKRNDEAVACFEKALTLNPKHPGSHNILARITHNNNNPIAALLAYCRFLSLEPQSKRAEENLAYLQEILKGNAEKTGKKSITINISSEMASDTAADGTIKENSFTSAYVILSVNAALDFDKKYAKETHAQQFLRKLEGVCTALSGPRQGNYGFFWDFYVPYFLEMQEKKYLERFSYIAFASSSDPDVVNWLKGHQKELDEFFDWSKKFEWKTK